MLKKILPRSSLLITFLSAAFLTACGGGGGGGGSSSGTVSNNGNIANPANYTLPNGSASTVPPTGN
jgi:hypothetical protein